MFLDFCKSAKVKKKSIKNVSFCNLINKICKQSLIATIHHSKVIQWLWKWGITRLYLIHRQNCIGWLKRGKNFMFFVYVRFSLAYFMCLIPVNGMFISYHFSGSKPFRIFILCLSNVKWFQNSRPETSKKSFLEVSLSLFFTLSISEILVIFVHSYEGPHRWRAPHRGSTDHLPGSAFSLHIPSKVQV